MELIDPQFDGPRVPLARFIAASRKLDLSGIAWERVTEHPLDDEARAVILFMADIEGYVVTYLRDLLNTTAIDDPEVARFLTLWAYEEMFHGEALVRFLAQYGVPYPADRARALRGRETLAVRVMNGARSAFSRLSDAFLGMYLTWGAIQELTTVAGYERLSARAGHPILTELLRRIVRDERRHFSFYYQRARERLRDPATRALTRWAVRRFWGPVGDSIKTPEETRAVIRYCFSGDEGRAAIRAVDRKIAELPGLEWFRMVEAYVDQVDTVVAPQGIEPRTLRV